MIRRLVLSFPLISLPLTNLCPTLSPGPGAWARAAALALLLGTVGGCSLFHQELPNEAPDIQVSKADTTRVKRGGSVRLEVLASDEDDDNLSYSWDSFGAGSFTDAASRTTLWIAPESIQGDSEPFLLSVTVLDRQCDAIPNAADRDRCQEEVGQVVQTFLIQVVQRVPVVSVVSDTAVSFREPQISLDAFGEDEDDDALDYRWEQLEGEPLELMQDGVASGGSRVRFTPLHTGEYRLAVLVSDGSDTSAAEVQVQVDPEPEPPADADPMVALTMATEESYQIDVYEYPNEKGAVPLLAASFFEAAERCAERGKRLCTAAEWTNACGGEELGAFSSSDDPVALPGSFGRRFCNAPGSDVAGVAPQVGDLAPSGSFANCSSSAGVYDMTGNAGEWVLDPGGSSDPAGTWSISGVQDGEAPCDAFAQPLPPLPPDADLEDPTYDGYRTPDLGFRCCR